MFEKAIRLLRTAGILLVIARLHIWSYRSMDLRCISVGSAFGCCIAAFNFKDQKGKEEG